RVALGHRCGTRELQAEVLEPAEPEALARADDGRRGGSRGLGELRRRPPRHVLRALEDDRRDATFARTERSGPRSDPRGHAELVPPVHPRRSVSIGSPYRSPKNLRCRPREHSSRDQTPPPPPPPPPPPAAPPPVDPPDVLDELEVLVESDAMLLEN